MAAKKYVTIHGHFYQPPRENPWINSIEPQESAAPFDNWNFRISRECYAPNAQSRVFDSLGNIKNFINNYEHISFNFGPTLISWLENNDPDTYKKILEADSEGLKKHNGHGPAIAQIYNHIIMPLANSNDRLTQVIWGIKDFEHRFKRKPEGMWLSETAVDSETLKILSQQGIRFTILAQNQAAKIRPISPNKQLEWIDVSGSKIDPRQPYRYYWGHEENQYIDLFFYDGPVSRSIAFEQLLSNGSNFLNRIEQAFGETEDKPLLVNLATDGESYGHHFKFGEMALSWVVDTLNQNEEKGIKLTNYSEFLSICPPKMEVDIHECSSWSCAHGVERWRSDCGCNVSNQQGWNQEWRKPLRDGLNWLNKNIAEIFEEKTSTLLKDPWQARNDYINVLINYYSPESKEEFFKKNQKKALTDSEKQLVMELMEAQKMSLFMFTSCAWFFDDIAGLEAVQNLRYALMAIDLTQPYASNGLDLQHGLLNFLKNAIPNDRTYPTGVELWNQLVLEDRLSSSKAAAHWAASVALKKEELLQMFDLPRFRVLQKNTLQGDEIEVLFAHIEIYDPRINKYSEKLCVAVYAGKTYLAILVDDDPKNLHDEYWEHNFLHDLFPSNLNQSAYLSVWDSMRKLLPKAELFTIDDLMPSAKLKLLSFISDDFFNSIKSYTLDHYHEYSRLVNNYIELKPNSNDWSMDFVARALSEAELKNILHPFEYGHPVNMMALDKLLNENKFYNIPKNDSFFDNICQLFLKNSFQELLNSCKVERKLNELFNFIQLIRNASYHVDIWNAQNTWFELSHSKVFIDKLLPGELQLFKKLGVLLGFSNTIVISNN